MNVPNDSVVPIEIIVNCSTLNYFDRVLMFLFNNVLLFYLLAYQLHTKVLGLKRRWV